MVNTELLNCITKLIQEGKTYKEIADMLHKNYSAIRIYCYRHNIGERKIPKKTDEEIKQIINNRYPKLEFIGGYTGADGELLLKCKICGYTFKHSSQMLRPSRHKHVKCIKCFKHNKTTINKYKKLKAMQNKYEKEILLYKKQKEKELNRIKKLSNKICNECGKLFNANHACEKYCCIKCKHKHKNRLKEIYRRKKMKENGKVDYSISLQKLYKRDKGICHICKKKVNMNLKTNDNYYGSIDHVIPISRGGTHTWDNIKLAHRYCNALKRDTNSYSKKNGQIKFYL